VLATSITTDTANQFAVRVNGELRWGPGSATQDLMLRREAAGVLAVRNNAETAYADLKADELVLSNTAKTAITVGTSGAGSGGITFGEALNTIYRITASSIGTDSAFIVGGALTVAGATSLNGNVRLGDSAADTLGFFTTAGAAQSTGWSIADAYTSLKTFNTSTATLGELKRVVATLIDVLKGHGLIAS
jgi:hypothetical protein